MTHNEPKKNPFLNPHQPLYYPPNPGPVQANKFWYTAANPVKTYAWDNIVNYVSVQPEYNIKVSFEDGTYHYWLVKGYKIITLQGDYYVTWQDKNSGTTYAIKIGKGKKP